MAAENRVLSDETYVPIANLQIGKTYRQLFLVENVTAGDNMVTAQGVAFYVCYASRRKRRNRGVRFGDTLTVLRMASMQ